LNRESVPKPHAALLLRREVVCRPMAGVKAYTPGPGLPLPAVNFSWSLLMKTFAMCSRLLVPNPAIGAEIFVPTTCGPIAGLSTYEPGPGLAAARFISSLVKRCEEPNTQAG